MSTKKWVDYKAVKEAVTIEQVLRERGLWDDLKPRGENMQGFCPLPSHTGKGKRSPSFSVKAAAGCWHCFSCGAKGNVIDLVAALDGVEFREAALQLAERYGVGNDTREETKKPGKRAKEKKTAAKKTTRKAKPKAETSTEDPKQDSNKERLVNVPLDFELTSLEADHPYLLEERELLPTTVAFFGLGYCSRGLMKGRVAIPIRVEENRLVGYAGRIIDDSAINEDTPRYMFPPKRETDTSIIEFHRSEILFNLHNLRDRPPRLVIVVEGFFPAFWLWQNGYQNVVALMGSSMSEVQEKLLCETLRPQGGGAVLFTDGDKPGYDCAEKAAARLSEHVFVRWVRLPEGLQPDHLSPAELDGYLGQYRR